MGKDNILTPLGNTKNPMGRSPDDYYITPQVAIDSLIRVEPELFTGVIWEPACGNGAISKRIPIRCLSSDIVYRGFGIGGVDFLRVTPNFKVDLLITNPLMSMLWSLLERPY